MTIKSGWISHVSVNYTSTVIKTLPSLYVCMVFATIKCLIKRKTKQTQSIQFCACRFCPSVFFYLASVVPAIWFLELHAMEDRIKEKAEQERFNLTTQNQNRSVEDLKIIIKDLGVRGIQPHWLLLDKSTNHFINL